MNTARAIAAIATPVVAVIAGTLAWTELAESDQPDRLRPTVSANYVEPTTPLADGRYLGYVRTTDLPDATVSVDFVSLTDGDIGNEQPEVLVYAGGLADLDLLERVARPFTIVVKDDTIVELQTADDLLPDDSAAEFKVVGSITRIAGMNGNVSVVLNGELLDIAADVDVFGADGDRVDIADWLGVHGSITIDSPLYVEATVDDGVIVSLQNQ